MDEFDPPRGFLAERGGPGTLVGDAEDAAGELVLDEGVDDLANGSLISESGGGEARVIIGQGLDEGEAGVGEIALCEEEDAAGGEHAVRARGVLKRQAQGVNNLGDDGAECDVIEHDLGAKDGSEGGFGEEGKIGDVVGTGRIGGDAAHVIDGRPDGGAGEAAGGLGDGGGDASLGLGLGEEGVDLGLGGGFTHDEDFGLEGVDGEGGRVGGA